MADAQPFSQNSKAKIVKAVRQVLGTPGDGTNTPRPAFPRNGRTSFMATVTLPDATMNKFAFNEVLADGAGGWTTPEGALTGDGTSDDAFAVNAFGIKKVPPGPVLITMGYVYGDTPGTTYTFAYDVPKALEYVTLSEDGGSEGTATTSASWTYTLTASDGNTYTSVGPQMNRIAAIAYAATHGIGILTTSGGSPAFTLVWCDEQPEIQHCGTGG